jgi:hypothetical protein
MPRHPHLQSNGVFCSVRAESLSDEPTHKPASPSREPRESLQADREIQV